MDAIDAFLNSLSRCKPLSKAEAMNLCAMMQAGDTSARDRLVESILPWCFKRMRHRFRDMDEAISLATEAAMRAVEYFDPSRGSLSLLAAYCCCTTGSAYRRNSSRSFLQDKCIKLDALPKSAFDHLVLKERIDQEPWEILSAQERIESVGCDLALLNRVLRGLPDRLRMILTRRAQGETLARIGVDLGVTRERVRQLELKALRDARRAAGRLTAERARGPSGVDIPEAKVG